MNKIAAINTEVLKKAEKWLNPSSFNKETIAKIKNWIDTDPEALHEAFYKDLEFGTGGMRGIMDVGTNRINIYTIGMATQGLANFLNNTSTVSDKKVVIAYDSRNNSKELAEEAALVLMANGIKALVFPELRPTPLLSFAVRYHKAQAGIVITASHNPKEYNGYKVYNQFGGQLVAPDDKNIIHEVRKIEDYAQVKKSSKNTPIQTPGQEVEKAYYTALKTVSKTKFWENGKHDLKIVYTALHGTGATMVEKALKEFGFKNIYILEQQNTPDGNFPTVKSPNPEEPSAMEMAIQLGNQKNADIVIGTDPDADRVGIAVKNTDGNLQLLNGNQAATLIVWYSINNKEITENHQKYFVGKTIVTTELIDQICHHHEIDCINVLTGFKYIAELIENKQGKQKFLCGGEESFGYLIDDFVRDKDAVLSSVYLSEIAAWAKDQGKTLLDLLEEIYQQFGYYKEHLISLTKQGESGIKEIKRIMDEYRKNPPSTIGGSKITQILDYQTSINKDIKNNRAHDIPLPTSNVLQFYCEDGSKITLRPSGTEPKIKFYISVKQPPNTTHTHKQTEKILQDRIEGISKALSS